MDIWAALMLLAGGLFSGGAATFAWSRVPIWRSMPVESFGDDFSATIRRTDKVQPALLILALVATSVFAASSQGAASILAWVGAGGFIITLIASIAILVPLQRRIIALAPTRDPAVQDMRQRWFRGHLGRSVLSTASFVSVTLAAVV